MHLCYNAAQTLKGHFGFRWGKWSVVMNCLLSIWSSSSNETKSNIYKSCFDTRAVDKCEGNSSLDVNDVLRFETLFK